jgi:hypothetical protein
MSVTYKNLFNSILYPYLTAFIHQDNAYVDVGVLCQCQNNREGLFGLLRVWVLAGPELHTFIVRHFYTPIRGHL